MLWSPSRTETSKLPDSAVFALRFGLRALGELDLLSPCSQCGGLMDWATEVPLFIVEVPGERVEFDMLGLCRDCLGRNVEEATLSAQGVRLSGTPSIQQHGGNRRRGRP